MTTSDFDSPPAMALADRVQEPPIPRCRGGTEPSLDAAKPLAGVVELAETVGAGERSPAEALECCRSRVLALDRFNAFATLCLERAEAELADLVCRLEAGAQMPPLAGIPIAHKDILLTAGVRTAAGSRLLAGHRPSRDATVVALLARAGALCIGKLNMHEFATGVTGTVSGDGPTLNPWDPERIAGGSSCGSAAAVAAGLVPAATGTDTGGSIRIPAACCGVVGLKPTYDLVSTAGVIPFAWSLDHVGPIARSVADIARILQVIRDPEGSSSGDKRRPGAAPTASPRPLDGIRFALPNALLDNVEAPVAAAVRQAGVVVEHLGAARIEIDLPPTLTLAPRIARTIFLTEGSEFHADTLRQYPDRYQAPTRELLAQARSVTATDYLQAQRLRTRLGNELARLFESVDILLSPTLPVIAPRASADRVALPRGEVDVRAALTTATRPYNLAGLPALSLPCGFEQGLPIGLQVVGPAFSEATVLGFGRAFEEATEWVRWPPGCGP